jgi:ribosomal protein L37AE/L43A
MDTISLVEDYRKIISKPRKVSFFGKNTENTEEKDDIIKRYIEIMKKYNFEIPEKQTQDKKHKSKETEPNKLICDYCKNKKHFHTIESRIYICEICGNQKEYSGAIISYNDVSRVNISSKYTYERRVHFKDCINRYQGKQNSTISNKVYEDLEVQFKLHGLLCEDNENKFRNITKDHILLFLKELGYTKHYEDVFLIYYKLTGKTPDDISYLEQKLMDDFDILSNLYDQKFKQTKRVDRKNFINTQYVLYQFLRKYKHICKKEDFNILKTYDRKSFHDDICSELFSDLGWNFIPFF